MLKKLVPREKLKRFYSPDYIGLSPVMKESFRLIVGERLEKYAEKITAKTLVLSGKDDKETPPSSQKRLKRLIGEARLELISGGHFCFVENAFEFNSKAFAFLIEG